MSNNAALARNTLTTNYGHSKIMRSCDKLMDEQILNTRRRKGIYSQGFLTSIFEELCELEKTKIKAVNQLNVSDMLKIVNIMATSIPEGLILSRDSTGILDYISGLDENVLVEVGGKTTSPTTTILGSDVKAAYAIPAFFSRSKWLKGTQTKTDYSRYGVLTPLALYAYKEFYKCTYESWRPVNKQKFEWGLLEDDRELNGWFDTLEYSKGLKFLLGHGLTAQKDEVIGLEHLAGITNLPEVDHDSMMDIRRLAYTYGGRIGYKITNLPRMIPDNKYKAFATYINRLAWPLRNILLQGHIANSAYRIPQAHILDLNNWDIVPQPYDGITNHEIPKLTDNFKDML